MVYHVEDGYNHAVGNQETKSFRYAASRHVVRGRLRYGSDTPAEPYS